MFLCPRLNLLTCWPCLAVAVPGFAVPLPAQSPHALTGAWLPAQINALFAPRPPVDYLPPIDMQLPKKRKREMHGIGHFTQHFETGPEYDEIMRTWKPIMQRKERREKIKEERMKLRDETLKDKVASWDPSLYSFESDAYKTLFIGRLNYMTDEHKIKREMEQYGPVKSVTLVYDTQTQKPRGYGFVEFEHERDMKTAYKHADGRKIDGRRVLVDVERGRTVKDWKPRRLGQGLGSSRKERPKQTKAEKAEKRRLEALKARAEARAKKEAAEKAALPPPAPAAAPPRRDDNRDRRGDYHSSNSDRGGGRDYRGGDRGGSDRYDRYRDRDRDDYRRSDRDRY